MTSPDYNELIRFQMWSSYTSVFMLHYSFSSSALEVELIDNSFPSDGFEVVRGQLSVKWTRLAPGTNATHSVILRPLQPGIFNFTSAEVTYKSAEENARQQVCGDNSALFLTHWSLGDFNLILGR